MIVLPVAERQGTQITASATLGQAGIWSLNVVGIPTADYENPALSFSLSFQFLIDGTWQQMFGLTWVGVVGGYDGKAGTHNPNPHITGDLSYFTGLQARAVLEVPVAMTFGIDISRIG